MAWVKIIYNTCTNCTHTGEKAVFIMIHISSWGCHFGLKLSCSRSASCRLLSALNKILNLLKFYRESLKVFQLRNLTCMWFSAFNSWQLSFLSNLGFTLNSCINIFFLCHLGEVNSSGAEHVMSLWRTKFWRWSTFVHTNVLFLCLMYNQRSPWNHDYFALLLKYFC